jgi:hypothetical protein
LWTKPNDVNACDNYTLPILTTGKYYTYLAGKAANPNVNFKYTKIYIYGIKGRFICEDESIYDNHFENTRFIATFNVAIWDLHTSTLVEGNYFTGTRGSGTKYFLAITS